MNDLRINVLGPLKIHNDAAQAPHPPAGVRRLVAVLVAAGSDGISKDELVAELWDAERPASWKSVIRNRITQARRHLGPTSILNTANRYQLIPEISIDSWELLERSTDAGSTPQSLDFLQGIPFTGIAPTPLIERHVRQIESARSLQIRRWIDNAGRALPAAELEALRLYHRENPLDPTVAEQTIRALVQANELTLAHEVIDHSKRMTQASSVATGWVEQLERRAFDPAGGARTEPIVAPVLVDEENPDRESMFCVAAEAEQWSLAYEVAMEGMPYAAQIGGDPDRLELLLKIPPSALDSSRAFRLAVTITNVARLTDPELARAWSRTAGAMAESADERFLAEVLCSMAGDIDDERRLFTLPRALLEPGVRPASMQSYQVGVANYLERASALESSQVCLRFSELVEASGDPYRRWYGLVLNAMLALMNGDVDGATDQAKQACNYGTLFGIAECDFGWRSQVLCQAWATTVPGQRVPGAALVAGLEDSLFSRAFRAVTSGSAVDIDAVIESFDIESKVTFCVPLLVLLSTQIKTAQTRQRVLDRLQTRSGTSAILGASLMHLGPVDRARALLTDDATAKTQLLTDAVELADSQETRLWQVLCRLDLARHTGTPIKSADIERLATTPALQNLVEQYA